ncbi:class I SAM-dependent methyltransferase [Paracidovorax anthurii]|uniref:O-methyltransferase involved in polyketide biosynthesis n=1 Tax=Paracidovorax anthurii TaxID=78229 RepID=A0A328Z889_9BURK|nr:class I SAM-dependent methyltransferase [Paracidovorax anthurii]RAR82271.1 O-methyltransferase involved in polyketide biosynthesis [Paracidovorax anthurii]WCM94106.1 class I SAM-dependent methyltransferase [Acidovorax sp. NCPPB 2350]
MTDACVLTGVPQTMLWTLHNRATEALRPNGWLRDAEAVRIYRSIPYDYDRDFGPPDASHATRSAMFDDALRPWLAAHPGGMVVELGSGLETQFQRCDDGQVRWLCVDVPEAIAVRERYLPASERCRHLGLSALDPAWLDEVDPSRGIFITAQGLFMYFEEADVRRLVALIAERLPGAELMFDVIPRWFSRKTLQGLSRTPHYQVPPMPWGLDRHEIAPLLHSWSPRIARVEEEPYRRFRTFPACLAPVIAKLPWLGRYVPSIVRLGVAQP